MPSRMSLRRTKQRGDHCASSSRTTTAITENESSREDLNLKTPKRPNNIIQRDGTRDIMQQDRTLKDIQNKLFSPSKVIEQLYEKISVHDVDNKLVEQVRDVFRRPKPLSVKRKMIDNLVDGIMNNIVKEKKELKEWCSPKKCLENTPVSSEGSIKRRLSKEAMSPYKSPLHTPKKTECEKQSPCKTSTPKEIGNQIIEDASLNNTTPCKVGDCDNVQNNEGKTEIIPSDDESSRSTFQLPPEFIADDSNDSLPLFEMPKLKTVDIQQDSSLEICENDEAVKVNVVKMEDVSTDNDFIKNLDLKSPLKPVNVKFSPIDKETLSDNVCFNVECFKNRYLNEVDRDFKCKFKHNHNELPEEKSKIKTAIDFATEASNERKRSIGDSADIPKKKRKLVKGDKLKKARGKVGSKKKIKKSKKASTDIELIDGGDNLKLSLQGKRKKKKTRVSIKDKEIKVRIQWKKKRLQVRITESENQKENSKLKQYVLKYKDVTESMLEKPKFDVTPMKRKYVKQGKSPDNLKQTSIQNFFKIKLPET